MALRKPVRDNENSAAERHKCGVTFDTATGLVEGVKAISVNRLKK
jgi:hypothetical protein